MHGGEPKDHEVCARNDSIHKHFEQGAVRTSLETFGCQVEATAKTMAKKMAKKMA